MAKRLTPILLIGLGLLAPMAGAYAGPVPIVSLFNTGVDANHNSLPNNALNDPHYQLVGVPAPSGTQTIVFQGVGTAGLYPIGPWAGNDMLSAWIAPNNATRNDNPAGRYYYQTTFDLTGYDPTTAVIYGAWAADDVGSDLLLNGVSQVILTSLSLGAQNYTGLTTFNHYFVNGQGQVTMTPNVPLQYGFLPGINTLLFRVDNDGGVTGLRTELVGTAVLIPEPASLGLLAFGIAAMLTMRRQAA